MKTFGFTLVMTALCVIVVLIGSLACAGPFNRCPVVMQNSYAVPTAAASITADVESPKYTYAQVVGSTAAVEPGVPLRDRCLLPFNCKDGKCRPPREEVNVNVTTPRCDPPNASSPSVVSVPPVEHPFPFGLLIAVVAPVALVSAVAAFFLRVAASPN